MYNSNISITVQPINYYKKPANRNLYENYFNSL